jgi:ribosomal protein S18 acetylase RimI-like enzyme
VSQEGFVVRRARSSDTQQIGQLIYLASQAQYSNSGYDLSIGGAPSEQVEELGRLAGAVSKSWFHYSHFEVVEIEGVLVGGAAGYERIAADEQLRNALRDSGWTQQRISAMEQRLGPVLAALPPEPEGFWTIDHVAVLPTWRRQGFAKLCLRAVISRGKAEGFTRSKVDVFRGNIAARTLYESFGYRLFEVFDDPAFCGPLHRDAIERLTRTL